MALQNETAAPTDIGAGGDISKVVTARKYLLDNDNARLPFTILGDAVAEVLIRAACLRYGVSRQLAKVVVGIPTDGRVWP